MVGSGSRDGGEPSLFLRLLVSHLLVVLACFVAGVLVVDHLFAPGVSMFLERHPIILVPTVLILIGIAGLAANWNAASIGLPIHRLTVRLKERAGRPLDPAPEAMGSEEAAELRDAVAAWQAAIMAHRGGRRRVHLRRLTRLEPRNTPAAGSGVDAGGQRDDG